MTPARRSPRSAQRCEALGIAGATGPARRCSTTELEHAVRIFQQHRGLITDGIVGPETYRALRDARWALGDRMLRYDRVPITGDDVFALQERLLELGYDSGRADGVFGRADRAGPARLPARLRHDLRRHVRAGARCARSLARPQGHRRAPGPAARAGAPAPRRAPALAASASSSTRATAAPTAACPWQRGRASPRPGSLTTSPAASRGGMAAAGMEALLSPGPDTTARPTPSAPASPTPPAPTSCSRCTSTPTRARRQRPRRVPLRHRHRRHLHGGRGPRGLHPPRAARPHPRCSTAAPRPEPVRQARAKLKSRGGAVL